MDIHYHNDVYVFVRCVAKDYNTTPYDVYQIIQEEIDTVTGNSSQRKSKARNQEIIQKTLANCRSWLATDRKKLTHQDIVDFRSARNFFNSITKRSI